ncbi:MAG: PAS domain-containing protein [Campylobacterales bacterium]|nr:PAS domain-containing protein [Campylobacterales bacterium]
MSFKLKAVLVFLGISFLPYIVTMLLFGNSFRQEQHKTITKEMKTQLNLTVERIDQHLFTLRNDMAFIAKSELMNDIYTQDLDRRISTMLLAKKNDLKMVGDFYVIDQNNNIVASSDFFSISQKGRGKAFFSVPILSSFSQQPIAKLIVTYPFENFKPFFSNSPERHYYIHHRNVTIDLRSSIFKESLKVSRNLQIKPDLMIVLEVEKSFAYQLLYKYERWFVLLLITGALFIIAAAYYVAKELIYPVVILSNTVKKITETQDYKQKVSVVRDDEIGDLSDAFNTMVSSIDKALKEKEDSIKEQIRLLNIIMGTGAGTWELNVQTGELHLNEEWANMLGYTLEELSPISFSTWENLSHPDDIVHSNEILKRHLGGELNYDEYEIRMRHKEGHWVWIYTSGSVVVRSKNGSPLWLAGVQLDISERKHAEEVIRESEMRYRALLDNANQCFLSFSADMILLHNCSAKCFEIFGSDIAGKHVAELLFPSDEKERAVFIEDLRSLIGDGDSLRVDNILSLLCNEFIIGKKVISAEYKMIGEESFMIILTDITEQIALEKNIAKEKKRLRMIVSAVENKNELFEILDEYKEFMKRRVEMVNKDKTALQNISNIYQSVHTFKGLFAQEEFITTPLGLHKLETKLSNFLSEGEITNEQLSTVLQKVELENWLQKDLSVLTQALGEDFFNQNNIIAINTERIDEIKKNISFKLEGEGVEEDKKEQILAEIEKLKHASIKELLSMYPRVVEKLSQKLSKSVYPMKIIGGEDIYLTDNCVLFIQSLGHVFRNCVDHGIENLEDRFISGKNDIATVSCVVRDAENGIEIVIADDGCGIDTEKVIEKAIQSRTYTKEEIALMSRDDIVRMIFHDNFSTADEVTDCSGRGIGMTAVKTEIEKLGGNVSVETKSGVGTTFIFFLPNANIRISV